MVQEVASTQMPHSRQAWDKLFLDQYETLSHPALYWTFSTIKKSDHLSASNEGKKGEKNKTEKRPNPPHTTPENDDLQCPIFSFKSRRICISIQDSHGETLCGYTARQHLPPACPHTAAICPGLPNIWKQFQISDSSFNQAPRSQKVLNKQPNSCYSLQKLLGSRRQHGGKRLSGLLSDSLGQAAAAGQCLNQETSYRHRTLNTNKGPSGQR